MLRKIFAGLIMVMGAMVLSFTQMRCAQIGMPTGGPVDTLAPRLLNVTPNYGTTGFKSNTIRFTFDEYIDLKDAQTQIIFSPLQEKNPIISYTQKTLTVRFRDSLKPNTTYQIQFGNALVDYNESNPYVGLQYVFSTGDYIDSLRIRGNVKLAESGKVDSTLILMLYTDLSDTAVKKRKPDYIARPNGKGDFEFTHLPSQQFRLYALKDADGGRTYNQLTEIFAFHDEVLTSSMEPNSVQLYAYQELKTEQQLPSKGGKLTEVWKIKSNIDRNRLSLIDTFSIDFGRKVLLDEPIAIQLLDSNQTQVAVQYVMDSTASKMLIAFDKQESMPYTMIFPYDKVKDTVGNILTGDTLTFTTLSRSDYAHVTLTFPQLDLNKKPVLQFLQGDKLVRSVRMTENIFKDDLFPIGTFDMRMLYDANGNGRWDPGSYEEKRQPEITFPINYQLTTRPDWEVEQNLSF